MAAIPVTTARADNSQEKEWVVIKFGGTSVSYGETWLQIVNRVKELQNGANGTSYNVLLVLSALTQVDSFYRSDIILTIE